MGLTCRADSWFPVGDLDAPAVAESLDSPCIGSRSIGVEENRVRVLAARILDHHDGQGFIPGSLVPDCLKLMHGHDSLLTVESDPDPFPLVSVVGEDRFWTRQTISLFSWTPSLAGRLRHQSVQGCIRTDFSRYMDSLWPTLNDLPV